MRNVAVVYKAVGLRLGSEVFPVHSHVCALICSLSILQDFLCQGQTPSKAADLLPLVSLARSIFSSLDRLASNNLIFNCPFKTFNIFVGVHVFHLFCLFFIVPSSSTCSFPSLLPCLPPSTPLFLLILERVPGIRETVNEISSEANTIFRWPYC